MLSIVFVVTFFNNSCQITNNYKADAVLYSYQQHVIVMFEQPPLNSIVKDLNKNHTYEVEIKAGGFVRYLEKTNLGWIETTEGSCQSKI